MNKPSSVKPNSPVPDLSGSISNWPSLPIVTHLHGQGFVGVIQDELTRSVVWIGDEVTGADDAITCGRCGDEFARSGTLLEPSITTVHLLNAVDTIVFAPSIPDQAFEPVEGIDDECLILVFFLDQRVDGVDDIVKRGGQRETRTIDLVLAVFRLNEDGTEGLRCSGGLTVP